MKSGLRMILVVLLLLQGVQVASAQEAAFSDEAEILLLAARNALKAGHRDTAMQRYRTLVERYPDVAEGQQELGWLLIQLGRREEGLTHLKRSGTAHPNDSRSRVQMVEVLLLDRRFQEANEELHALLEAFPSDVHVQIQLANYYAYRRRFPQAQRLFETLLSTEVDKESRMGLVHVAMARGDLEPASRYLADLTQRFPDDLYIKKQQVLLWGRQGRIASAYKELAQINEPSLRALTKAELLNVTGQSFSAEFEFSRLIGKPPRDYAVMMGLAYAYVGQHDESRAAAAFQSVLQQFPEDLEARLAFIEVLMHQRRWESGREILAEVLQEEPDVLEAIYLNHQLNHQTRQAGHARVALSDLDWWRTLMKSPAEAIRAKQQLVRFEDLHGIRVVSEPFVRKMPMATPVLSQWTDAMIRTGRVQEGLDLLLSLQDQQAPDVNRSIAIATFQVHQGHNADARATLEHVPATVEKAALYQQMKQSTNAAELFSEVVRQDTAHTHAQIGAITSFAAIGREERASATLSQLFNDCPREGWSALAGLLVYTEGSTRPYQIMLQAELKSRGLDGNAERFDARLRYFSLLSQLEHHTEVVNGYRILDQENRQRPDLVLRLARSLVRDHESRAIHKFQPALDVYDRYLALKPYDVAVWSEKARFLGWQSQYGQAEKEYEAILAHYPAEEVVPLELEGKRRFWRDHARMAFERDREVLELQPQHEEALSDLGQIQSSRYRFSDSQPYYRRLLAENPGHHLASDALELTNIFARPQITTGIGYVKMDGFDGSLLTKFIPVTTEIFAPFSQDVWAGVGYQWVNFDISGRPSSANIGRVMARYGPSPFWHVDGYVSGLTYSGTDKSNLNFGAGLSYEWLSGLKGRVETGRQDLWQNAETIRRNLSYHSYAVGVEYQMTRELELTAGAGYWDYSDNNWNVNGQFSGTYTLLPFPHPLRVTYQLDTFGFEKERAYFSPDFFAKNTLMVGWQHFLGFPGRREYHGESPMRNRYSGIDIGQYLGWPTRPIYLPRASLNAYSFDYGFSVDDESNLYHQLSASFGYALTKRCHLHAVGMIIRADVVDQDSINGFVQCHL